MKLYYKKGACSLAVRITIHELGLPCEYEAVDFRTKITASGENFLNINPKGYVPVLLTDEHEVITENPAIQVYLAESNNAFQLLPPIGNIERYRVLEWLAFTGAEVHKAYGPLLNPKISAEEKKDIFIPLLKKKFAIAEQDLAKNHYLTGDNYTVADSYFFVMLTWTPGFHIDLKEFPNLDRYFNELKNRPSIVAAIKEE